MNVDQLCYKYGTSIADQIGTKSGTENILRNLAAVIKIHGPYAFYLFLESKSGKIDADKIAQNMITLLKKYIDFPQALTKELEEIDKPLVVFKKMIEHIATNVPKLTLAKKLLDQTLAYAVYHQKALKKQNESTEATS